MELLSLGRIAGILHRCDVGSESRMESSCHRRTGRVAAEVRSTQVQSSVCDRLIGLRGAVSRTTKTPIPERSASSVACSIVDFHVLFDRRQESRQRHADRVQSCGKHGR